MQILLIMTTRLQGFQFLQTYDEAINRGALEYYRKTHQSCS